MVWLQIASQPEKVQRTSVLQVHHRGPVPSSNGSLGLKAANNYNFIHTNFKSGTPPIPKDDPTLAPVQRPGEHTLHPTPDSAARQAEGPHDPSLSTHTKCCLLVHPGPHTIAAPRHTRWHGC